MLRSKEDYILMDSKLQDKFVKYWFGTLPFMENLYPKSKLEAIQLLKRKEPRLFDYLIKDFSIL